ncbi:hypothetical protein [Escherichia coli]|uniref:hypothetical protein n=1 Tax=Escherichia coli TaxID=562 RepID=UPI000BE6DF12|nr:hypothetical protein [Escherichia coli]
MTLTKSWLQKQITDLEVTRDEIPFGLDEDGNNTLAALKMALAVEGQEPVYQVFDEAGGWFDIEKCYVSRETADGNQVRVLYTDPQPLTTSERSELENYRNAQQVVHVDADDNFYSWFGREWHEHYQHNQYTTAAKQMLGVMAESAWNACRAAKLQAGNHNERHLDMVDHSGDANEKGNSPVIPDGWVMVPVEPTMAMLDEFDSIIDYGAEDSKDAWSRLIAAAPQQENV